MHAAEKLKNQRQQGHVRSQEPLIVEFVEYISDAGEEGFPWPH